MKNPSDVPEGFLLMGLHAVVASRERIPMLTVDEAREEMDNSNGMYLSVKRVAIQTNLRKAWLCTNVFDAIHGEGTFAQGIEKARGLMKSEKLHQA